MAVSSFLVTAHEQAHRSAAQTALSAVMPARVRFRDRSVRRAIARVEQAAQTGGAGQLLTEVLRIVDNDRIRFRHPQVSERAGQLLSFAQPPEQDGDFGYTERAVGAFEELGAQPVYVEALRAAIAADRPIQEWDAQLLQTDAPDLFSQWNTQPDSEVRGRVAERMSAVLELLDEAYSREPTYVDESSLYSYELVQSGEEEPAISEKVQHYRAELTRTYDRQYAASQAARAAAEELNRALTSDELAGRPAATPPPDERALAVGAYRPAVDVWRELERAEPPDWMNGPWPTHEPLPSREAPTGDWLWQGPTPASPQDQSPLFERGHDTSEINGGPDQEVM